MTNNNDNISRGAFAASAAVSRRNTESIIDDVMSRYQTQRNVHTVGGSNDDRQARKDEYIEEQRHQKALVHEQELVELTKERISAEKSGNAELLTQLNNTIRQTKIDGPESIGFDTDEVSINISSTLEEIASSFSDLSRHEQKAEIERIKSLKEMVATSSAQEKEFLVSQTDNILSVAQKEYDKRSTLAAHALEKTSELAESYLDVSSLYAGFVDHNPVMMGLFKMGADLIRRSRETKKHQKESFARDNANMQAAEMLNDRKALREEQDSRRDDEINTTRQQILEAERNNVQNQTQSESNSTQIGDTTTNHNVETVDGFDASGIFDGIQSDDDEPTIQRDAAKPTTFAPTMEQDVQGGDPVIDINQLFNGIQSDDDEPAIQREQSSNGQAFEFPQDEFGGTGDEPLAQDFMSALFGETDEDGDATGFTIEQEDIPTVEVEPTNQTEHVIEPVDNNVNVVNRAVNDNNSVISRDDSPTIVKVDSFEPVNVKMGESTPEQKAEALFIRQDAERAQAANDQFNAETTVREEAIIVKLTDLEDAANDGNKIASKNAKSLEKIDGGGGLLEMLGLGKVGALFKGPILKALMMFAPAVTAIGGLLAKFGLGGIGGKLTDKFDNLTEKAGGDRNARANKAKNKPGKIQRAPKPKGGGMLGKLAKGAGGLLTSGAGIAAAGAVGYGVGTLINDHVLSDDTKESIGDFIGPKIDSVLSFFGNEEAEKRLEFQEQQKAQNAKTMGVAAPKDKPKLETAPKDASVMEKSSGGGNVVVQADSIASTKVVNNTSKGISDIEVPVQKKTETKLQMLEEKVTQLADAKAEVQAKPTVIQAPAKRSSQKQVQSAPSNAPIQTGRSARNSDSSIQRVTDRLVGMGMA